MEKYKFENGKVFEYDRHSREYVFIGNLNGLAEEEWLDERECDDYHSTEYQGYWNS